jgi:hypothetical protein
MFGLYPRGHRCTIFLGLFSLGNFAPLFLSVFPGLLVPCEIQHDLLAAARMTMLGLSGQDHQFNSSASLNLSFILDIPPVETSLLLLSPAKFINLSSA